MSLHKLNKTSIRVKTTTMNKLESNKTRIEGMLRNLSLKIPSRKEIQQSQLIESLLLRPMAAPQHVELRTIVSLIEIMVQMVVVKTRTRTRTRTRIRTIKMSSPKTITINNHLASKPNMVELLLVITKSLIKHLPILTDKVSPITTVINSSTKVLDGIDLQDLDLQVQQVEKLWIQV